MRINPNLFDHKGRLRLGSGSPTCVKWHPLFAEDEMYHYLAASYTTGEIKMFRIEEESKDGKCRLTQVDMFRNPAATDTKVEYLCLDWSPDGQFLIAGYADGRLRMFNVCTNKRVENFDACGKESADRPDKRRYFGIYVLWWCNLHQITR